MHVNTPWVIGISQCLSDCIGAAEISAWIYIPENGAISMQHIEHNWGERLCGGVLCACIPRNSSGMLGLVRKQSAHGWPFVRVVINHCVDQGRCQRLHFFSVLFHINLTFLSICEIHSMIDASVIPKVKPFAIPVKCNSCDRRINAESKQIRILDFLRRTWISVGVSGRLGWIRGAYRNTT